MISIRNIFNGGSQIPEPLLMFTSTCLLKAQVSQGLGHSFQIELGNFTSQDFGVFCAVLARIRRLPSAILVGHLTMDNYSLRKSTQNFHTNCAEKHKNPGSRNSPD